MELSAPSAAPSASPRCEERLSDCGIRPTAQRVRIAALLLSAPQHLSAERCWGADRSRAAMRTRWAVGRIPQSDSRSSQRGLALGAADGALSSISKHYRHKTAPACEFYRHGLGFASGLSELALKVLGELGDGREVEQLGQIHLPRVLLV